MKTQIHSRIRTYNTVANDLALLSNKRLSELLSQATSFGTSIGGTSLLLNLGGTNIFVKKIRLTDIEKQPENIMSTANLFNLPSYCQYGIGEGPNGSPGFGVWRELATNIMTTNWVLAGECSNFPMLYHWRILLKDTIEPPSSDVLRELESNVEYWEGSEAVRSRLEANLKASYEVVLFLEYFPETVNKWLSKLLAIGGVALESALKMVESELHSVASFINSHGLLHFDAHFENILTDGNHLYFTDFGLATCLGFELSQTELEFFETHRLYDRCYIAAHLVNWLGRRIANEGGNDSPAIASILKRNAPMAVVMNEFFRRHTNETRKAEYPKLESEQLCN